MNRTLLGWKVFQSRSLLKKILEKHVKGDPHLHAVNLKKKKLGAETFNQEVVSSSPIGRGLAKMAEKVK